MKKLIITLVLLLCSTSFANDLQRPQPRIDKNTYGYFINSVPDEVFDETFFYLMNNEGLAYVKLHKEEGEWSYHTGGRDEAWGEVTDNSIDIFKADISKLKRVVDTMCTTKVILTYIMEINCYVLVLSEELDNIDTYKKLLYVLVSEDI